MSEVDIKPDINKFIKMARNKRDVSFAKIPDGEFERLLLLAWVLLIDKLSKTPQDEWIYVFKKTISHSNIFCEDAFAKLN